MALHRAGREKPSCFGEISWRLRAHIADNVNDLSRGFFHIEHDGVYPADQIVIRRITWNSHCQSRRSANESLPDTARKVLHIGQGCLLLKLAENIDEPQHRAKQAHQWRDLGDS